MAQYNAHTNPDLLTRKEDIDYRKSVIAANDAFVALMMRQVKRGKEHVAIGTIIDTSPCTTKRLRGEPLFSGAGSPAQMCAEKGDTDVKAMASYV